jgi:CheY-like chemotaxis protein
LSPRSLFITFLFSSLSLGFRDKAILTAMTDKTILLIDDENNLRETISMCLEDLGGWQVLSAESGQQGLQIANRQKLDAIVLDVSMPVMDGFTFLKLLRTNPDTALIPVVLLTAYARSVSSQQLKQFAVAGAIEKPFSAVKLPSQIAAFLHWEWNYEY